MVFLCQQGLLVQMLPEMLSPSSRLSVIPGEFKGSLCFVQARRNEEGHPYDEVWREEDGPVCIQAWFAKWKSEAEYAASDHFVSGQPLPGRCASSGNHHLRVTGYAVSTALIATPISAITTAVSDVDQ